MISADDILSLAGRLALTPSLGVEEARCRSAISRAYYAAFHFAKDFLRQFEIKLNTGPSGHGEAVRYLFNCGYATAQVAARRLEDLRTIRNHADYNLEMRGLDNNRQAMVCVEQAADFKSDLIIYLQNRAAIQAGLAAWKANPASR
jgi:uncharacterized protein (UPF0332 family)